jgi:hypothetical protein
MLAHITTVTVAVDPDALIVAAGILAAGFGMLVFAVILADRRGLFPGVEVPFGRWVTAIVAALSLGAASIHLAVIGPHLEEYPPYGIAFAGLAGFQVVSAIAYLVAPRRRVAWAAIAINAGALLVWLTSRTVGLPFGPDAGQVEPVGSLDLAAGAMEVALTGVLAWHLGVIGRKLRPALPRAGAASVLGSSTLAVVLLTTTAFVSAGDPHGGAAHEPITLSGGPPASPAPASRPSATALVGDVLEPTASAAVSGSAAPSAMRPTPSPSPLAPAATSTVSGPTASATPRRSPGPSPGRATPAPTRRPTPTRPPTPPPPPPPPPASPGEIRFGSSLDQDGEIATPTNRFGEGDRAVWIADFSEAPGVSMIRLLIVQVLPDGREFEHWREDIPIADPASRRLIGGADLSVYLHGGDGRHVMRYMRGDTLLGEGVFDYVR